MFHFFRCNVFGLNILYAAFSLSRGHVAYPVLSKAAVGGSDEERALRKKKRKSKEDDRFNAVKSAIIKRLGDTCDVGPGIVHGVWFLSML